MQPSFGSPSRARRVLIFFKYIRPRRAREGRPEARKPAGGHTEYRTLPPRHTLPARTEFPAAAPLDSRLQAW